MRKPRHLSALLCQERRLDRGYAIERRETTANVCQDRDIGLVRDGVAAKEWSPMP